MEGPDTKANGDSISNTALGLKSGLMGPSMKETMSTGKNRGKASSRGLMGTPISATSIRIIYRDRERTLGQTVGATTGPGSIIRCRDKVPSTGRMDVPIRVTTLTTKKKAMVSSSGLTVVSSKAPGKTGCKRDLRTLPRPKAKRGRDCGRMENELNGSKKKVLKKMKLVAITTAVERRRMKTTECQRAR